MKCQMSDAEKAELLYSLYEQEMYRVCFKILNDSYAAEDAVSESFLKLLKKRDSIVYPHSDSCKRYAIKTAKNTAIDMYRRCSREREMFTELSSLTDNETAKGSSDVEYEPLYINGTLDCLTKKHRDVVECIYISGLTVRETSSVLKISETCVRKRLERAKRQLESIKQK